MSSRIALPSSGERGDFPPGRSTGWPFQLLNGLVLDESVVKSHVIRQQEHGTVREFIAVAAGVQAERVVVPVIEKAFINVDRSALLRSSEQMNDAKNKDLFEENLAILETLIRDMWTLKNGSLHEAIRNFDIADELERVSMQIDPRQLEAAMNEIESLRQSFAVNINRKSATDALFMKIAA